MSRSAGSADRTRELVPKKRAGRPEDGAPHRDETVLLQEVPADPSAPNASSRSCAALVVSRRKAIGTCPVCGGAGKLTVTEKPPGSHPPFWVQCWRCPGGKAYTDDLRVVVGVAASLILNDPLTHLAPWLNDVHDAERTPAPLPTISTVRRWNVEGLSERHLTYLRETRGLTDEAISRHLIGHDGHAYTLPIFDGTRLVNVRRRLDNAPPGRKYLGLRGRGSQLYPDVPAKRTLLLVAGEFDALIARQVGLPALSTTCGATLPEHLVPPLANKSVAVAYDVGEESKAEITVVRLRRAGADAWVVPMGERMPHDGDDLTDWFVRCGLTRHDFIHLAARARRTA
jgi:hypothetical protein